MNDKIIEISVKQLVNEVNAPNDNDKCRDCYLIKQYGSTDGKPLSVRKLITHLVQQDMEKTVAIEIGDTMAHLTEDGYMDGEKDTLILTAKEPNK